MTTKMNIAGIVVVGAYLGGLLTKWFLRYRASGLNEAE